jgi:hypothetical protein
MKYVKMITEWLYDEDDQEDKFKDSKYELKPGVVFQTSGDMLLNSVEQMMIAELFFQEKGYSRKNWFTFDEEDFPLILTWATDKKYRVNKKVTSGEIAFKDWFQLKYEYRGHHLKKFGV